jgi:hypothetical protein
MSQTMAVSELPQFFVMGRNNGESSLRKPHGSIVQSGGRQIHMRDA